MEENADTVMASLPDGGPTVRTGVDAGVEIFDLGKMRAELEEARKLQQAG